MGDPPAVNRLYFGDCLEVMREDIPDESVDLIYLDPSTVSGVSEGVRQRISDEQATD